MLTAEHLRTLVEYAPATGTFTSRRSGRPIGFLNYAGYLCLDLAGGRFKAHRIAFLYMTGSWPEGVVDHLNRDRLDNRWRNLRDVTQRENVLNRAEVLAVWLKYARHWPRLVEARRRVTL